MVDVLRRPLAGPRQRGPLAAHPLLPELHSGQRTAAQLRVDRPTVFVRVDEDAVLLDLRTVPPDEDEDLTRAVRYAREQL